IPAEANDIARGVDQNVEAAVGIGVEFAAARGIGGGDGAVPKVAALLPGEARRIDEDGTEGGGVEGGIEFQLLVVIGGVGIGVDGAVDGILLVVCRAVAFRLTEQFAGIVFFPVSDLLLAVSGDLAPDLQGGGRRLSLSCGNEQGKGPAGGGGRGGGGERGGVGWGTVFGGVGAVWATGAAGAGLGSVKLTFFPGAGAPGGGPGKVTCQLSRGSDGRRTGGTLAVPLLSSGVAAARSDR